jgi:hypothetical protein
MELSDELNERIESYLDGSLEEADQQEFEALIAATPELGEEIAFRQKTRRAIEALKFKQEFQKIRATATSSEEPQEKVEERGEISRPFWSRYAVAASITLLLVAGFLYKSDVFSPTSQRAFNKYYQAETYARGGCPQELPFFKNYADGRYQEALDQVNTLPTDSIFCITYFKGLCYLAQDQSATAIPLFSQATESKNGEVKNKAKWYLSMAYLEANDNEKAKKMLQEIAAEPENPYSNPASQIISDFFSN